MPMKIDLIMAPGKPRDLQGKTVVVIDVLRATSTILTALANGCREVVPVVEPEEAFALAGRLGRDRCLLGGERKGIKIPGFDLGNSPAEYKREVVAGKTVVLCTTNGTTALKEAQSGAEVLVGAFLNMSRITSYLKQVTGEIVLFCAGKEGAPALEDLLCAGMIVDHLVFAAKKEPVEELTDTAKIAMFAARQMAAGPGPVVALAQTEHGRYLSSLGFTGDLRYCGQVDLLSSMAVFEGGRIILKQNGAPESP